MVWVWCVYGVGFVCLCGCPVGLVSGSWGCPVGLVFMWLPCGFSVFTGMWLPCGFGVFMWLPCGFGVFMWLPCGFGVSR